MPSLASRDDAPSAEVVPDPDIHRLELLQGEHVNGGPCAGLLGGRRLGGGVGFLAGIFLAGTAYGCEALARRGGIVLTGIPEADAAEPKLMQLNPKLMQLHPRSPASSARPPSPPHR